MVSGRVWMPEFGGKAGRIRRLITAVVVATLATAGPVAPAGAVPVPLVAQAGQALVAPGLDQAAKPGGPAKPAPAAEAAAPTTTAGGLGSLKTFAVSYALITLLIGLGTFIICRPRSMTFVAKAKKE